MKRDIKSFLSISLAAMDQPSTSNVSTNIDVSLDVCVDAGISDEAEDDSTFFTGGISSNIVWWSEATT